MTSRSRTCPTLGGWAATILCLLSTPGAASSEGINLSWNDCGTFGNEVQTFACDVNTGSPFTLVGSFAPPANVTEFREFTAELTLRSWNALLPDWWKHGTGYCRGTTGMSSSFDFTGGPYSCSDFFVGRASGGFNYEPGFGGPDFAQLRVLASVSFEDRGPLNEGEEYYAFMIRFLRSKTVGTGSCSNCSVPVSIAFNNLQLIQPPQLGFDPIITMTLDRDVVRWQEPPAGVGDLLPGAVALHAVRWDRDGRAGRVALTLPRRGSATLELHDVTGRRLGARVLDDMAAGRHDIELQAQAPLFSGVYFLRLVQGASSSRLKLVFAR